MNPEPGSAGAAAPANCVFKRAKKPRRNIRGRARVQEEDSDEDNSEPEDDDDEEKKESKEKETSAVVRIDRSKNKRGIHSRAGGMGGRMKKRKGDGSDSDADSSAEEAEHARKERMNAVGIAFDGTGKQKEGPRDMGATATVEIDADLSKDHRAQEERAKALREATENPLEDKTYKGLKAYAKYIEKKDTAAGSAHKMTATGPQRAPSNVRSTVRWDYEPNICKDFKETGYCGFGDTCKFMHDRSDYKLGWQLEREMKDGTYGDDDEDDDKYVISSDDEDLPFKCFLCRDSFTDPVVTKCKHYFCEKCALEHYKKTQRCAACGRQTNGMFNPAKEIISKLAKMNEKEDGGGGFTGVGDDSDSD